jgi:hypothetical protein
MMIELMEIPFERGGNKFYFDEVKYHQATALKSLSLGNGSIFHVGNEKDGCLLDFNFNKKKGIFDKVLLEKMTYFLDRMEKTNKIDCYIINQNKVEILGYDWEFKITPNSTKVKCNESTFASNVILLMIKNHYKEAFNLSLQETYDYDVLGSIKYANKMLKSHFKVSQKDITDNRKVA